MQEKEKLEAPEGWDWDSFSDTEKAAWQRLSAMASFRKVAEAKMSEDPELWAKESNSVGGFLRNLATTVVMVGGGMVPEPDVATIRKRPELIGFWVNDTITRDYARDAAFVLGGLYGDLIQQQRAIHDRKHNRTPPTTKHPAVLSQADLDKIVPDLRMELVGLRMEGLHRALKLEMDDAPPYIRESNPNVIDPSPPANHEIARAHVQEAIHLLRILSTALKRYDLWRDAVPVRTPNQQATLSLADLDVAMTELWWVAWSLRKMQQEPS